MKRITIYALLALGAFSSCSKSHDNTPVSTSKCLADKMQLTLTQTQDASSSHIVILTFDVKNTGTANYDVGSGSNPIYIKVTVNTTNGKSYSDEGPLTATSISSGATASAAMTADYGAGNVYKDFKIESVYCK